MVFERLQPRFGLIRSGVAPDTSDQGCGSACSNRRWAARCGMLFQRCGRIGYQPRRAACPPPRRRLRRRRTASRSLGIAASSCPATTPLPDVVAWYNGHPDHAGDDLDSAHARVIIGNGNVALDVAGVAHESGSVGGHASLIMHSVSLAAGSIEEVVIWRVAGPRTRRSRSGIPWRWVNSAASKFA